MFEADAKQKPGCLPLSVCSTNRCVKTAPNDVQMISILHIRVCFVTSKPEAVFLTSLWSGHLIQRHVEVVEWWLFFSQL